MEMRPGSGGSEPRVKHPNEYWGIDMTKFMVESVGWVYLVVVLDWYTTKVVGWNFSLRIRPCEWREAFNMTLNNQFADGVQGNELKVISDNGFQLTSCSFIHYMVTLRIEQIFMSCENPGRNADTERVMKTIKERWSG